MAARDPSEIPIGMRRLCRRFERWRAEHKPRTPFPDALWAAAGEMARAHGVFRTAKILRLEYGKLRQAMQSAPPGQPVAARRSLAATAFLELAPSSVALGECLIELEGARGKLRIQWKGTTAPDLAGLGRALWESA